MRRAAKRAFCFCGGKIFKRRERGERPQSSQRELFFLGGTPNKAVLFAWLRMKTASKGV